ncbi:MAG: DUF6356 family protein [Pseudomonadota bacterium]
MRLFTEHPATVGETYVEHMGSAFSFGTEMVTAGFACLLHGLFPFLFEKTGSNAIQRLHHRMVTHRDKRSYGAAGSAPAGPAE